MTLPFNTFHWESSPIFEQGELRAANERKFVWVRVVAYSARDQTSFSISNLSWAMRYPFGIGPDVETELGSHHEHNGEPDSSFEGSKAQPVSNKHAGFLDARPLSCRPEVSAAHFPSSAIPISVADCPRLTSPMHESYLLQTHARRA